MSPNRSPNPRRSSQSDAPSIPAFMATPQAHPRNVHFGAPGPIQQQDAQSPDNSSFQHTPQFSDPFARPLATAAPAWRTAGRSSISPQGDLQSPEEFPRRTSDQLSVGPTDTRRGSASSDETLYNPGEEDHSLDQYKKYSFSSYDHPYDIDPPPNARGSTSAQRPRRSGMRRTVSFADDSYSKGKGGDDDDDIPRGCDDQDRPARQRGVLSNLIELYALNHTAHPGRSHRRDEEEESMPALSRRASSEYSMGARSMGTMRRGDSYASLGSDMMLDPDDPRVTGKRLECLEDEEDVKRNALRQMDYRARRKERMRIRIEFNISSVVNRHKFLLKLARALMTFGAPSHRVESQLVAAARILEVDAEFIHLPSVIICSFGDSETKTSETHFVKCGGRLALGNLHKLHLIYRSVVHDEISAKKATVQLEALLTAKPVYPNLFRCALAFCLSALICPLAFGGSFIDMWIAGAGAFILCSLQLTVATKSAIYANVFEITIAIFMSFAARGLSSIRSEIFCYTAISSAGIIGILPGYLILSSSLELASKNIVCGSVKMVYALIYTLFLGFGLQIGSDLYLLFDPASRHHLSTLAASMSTTVTLQGSFLADNGTTTNTSIPLSGTWTFTNSTPLLQKHIVEGCYRPPTFPWYLQPFPFWSQFVIVPVFSTLSSLANLQPFKSKQLPVMVIISCISYAANKTANHYIFNRSDIVSAIGAFTVGVLGNVYSRKMGGTAFTSMVTGVLFLVPSGLSQAGGITANGNGIDIGGAMIAVTIGITVGLFMSQALVYTFGSRKNAAVFSF